MDFSNLETVVKDLLADPERMQVGFLQDLPGQ